MREAPTRLIRIYHLAVGDTFKLSEESCDAPIGHYSVYQILRDRTEVDIRNTSTNNIYRVSDMLIVRIKAAPNA